MPCSASLRTDSGFFRPEVCAEPWPALLWGCIAGGAMGVVPHALHLSVEPTAVAGSPPSFPKEAVPNSMIQGKV